TLSLAYAPKRMDDLPVPLDKLSGPVVYNLLGRVSALPEYAVTEEDTLEFVHTLQATTKGLEKLLAALRSNSILLIGSGYPDWLMRFFLRLAKGDRLLMASKPEFVVDARSRNDASLGHFLRHFSAQTKVFPGGALEFIDELFARWAESGGRPAAPAAAPVATGAHPIFISYASEDRPQVQRLVDALRLVGVPVWFDESGGTDPGLQGGDDFEKVIGRAIRDASFFAPVLSRSVLTPERRFFRMEWTAALEQDKQVAENQKFIVPLRLGELSPSTPAVPERFRSLKWLPLGEGAEFDATVRYLREQYEQYCAARSAAP
ncbi:MAG TPA: toll/interleukin-1 receptor domain-containing protein, partial [Longimicrobium sp.]|nr:toll/interleukin-1 receptor domain-containing protein [Longimicrobium sp.]